MADAPGPNLGKCLFQSFVVERLEQVIDRLGSKGLDGKFLKRSDEDDRRAPGGFHSLDQAESVKAGQLHVEQQQIRLEPLDLLSGRFGIAAFAHHVDVGFVGEVAAHPRARQRHVIDDQDFEFHGRRNSRGTEQLCWLLNRLPDAAAM